MFVTSFVYSGSDRPVFGRVRSVCVRLLSRVGGASAPASRRGLRSYYANLLLLPYLRRVLKPDGARRHPAGQYQVEGGVAEDIKGDREVA